MNNPKGVRLCDHPRDFQQLCPADVIDDGVANNRVEKLFGKVQRSIRSMTLQPSRVVTSRKSLSPPQVCYIHDTAENKKDDDDHDDVFGGEDGEALECEALSEEESIAQWDDQIDRWLVKLKVRRHGERCEHAMQTKRYQRNKPDINSSRWYAKENFTNGSSLQKGTSLSNTTSTEIMNQDWESVVSELSSSTGAGSGFEAVENQCAICGLQIQAGEHVTWSPNADCAHIFHHECLKEHLLASPECPCCFKAFVPMENGRLIESRCRTPVDALYSICCEQHGIHRLNRIRCCPTAQPMGREDTMADSDDGSGINEDMSRRFWSDLNIGWLNQRRERSVPRTIRIHMQE